MPTRRSALQVGGLLGMLAALPALDGCGTATTPTAAAAVRTVSGTVARDAADEAAVPGAAAIVRDFSADLYRQLANTTSGSRPGNLVCSPYSVAVALAMARTGARGRTATEMDSVLHAGSGGASGLGVGFDALTRAVDSRAGTHRNFLGKKARIDLHVANSLWGQSGERWKSDFLDDLARWYGAGLQTVDYERAADAARIAIDAWVSAHTAGRIPHLIPPGVLDGLTRLVLVNAIVLTAPWDTPFETGVTTHEVFTRADGSGVRVPTMHADSQADQLYARGDGWQAVDLPYAGGELAMSLVLPDPRRLAAVEAALTGPGLHSLISGFTSRWVQVSLPRWTARTSADLVQPLSALGMPTAFSSDADFSGMTTEDALYLKAALHQAWIEVDEQGTKAAAATAEVSEATSARGGPHVTLRFDRPFLWVIHDVATGTPLFLGRVADPSAAATSG
jgi:serine protease inhibitor